MNIEFLTTTLWITLIWPLLLSIPSLHKRLPWPRHLAIIPAIVLTVTPIDVSINIPWLLFGTGLAIDGNVRWILGVFLLIWIATVSITSPSNEKSPYSTTLYLLTLTGSLGALLTTDLPAFFSFSTLMGYAFYGLLNQHANKTQQRAARIYLYFLIIADLALFEALLLVAFTTQYFQFEVARQAMSDISSSAVYLYMVLLGFMLKAGIWPFYIWLTATFNSATRATALLVIASPITISMLGLLRWLPVRDDIYMTGIIMQLSGAGAILHSVFKIFTRLIFKQGLFRHGMVYFTTAWLLIAFTGLFSLVLGTALLNPALWQQYVYLVYPFIAITSITLTIMILLAGKNHRKLESTDDASVLINKLFYKLQKWHQTTQQLASQLNLRLKSIWNNSGSLVNRQYQQVVNNQKNKSFVISWKINITLFLILGLAITWLAI